MPHTLRVLVLATLPAAGVLLAPGRAAAHAMHATVTVTADAVKLEAFYDEELPADDADVTVTDADGNVVASGKTDERGLWTAPRPAKPGTYKLTVRQAGHVSRRTFEISAATDPDAADGPEVYGGRRLNKWLGLSIGVLILLAISAASWWRHRRARRLE
jgi:hypothetical protein